MNMKDIHKRIDEDYDRMVEEYVVLYEKYPNAFPEKQDYVRLYRSMYGGGKCHTQETS